MKKTLLIILLFSTTLLIISCDKEKDFVEDNSTLTGVGYAPVSANTLQDVSVTPLKNLATSSGSATSYAGGASLTTELTFFSQSPVKETQVYTTISSVKTLINTIPYAPAYSNKKSLDTLLVSYTVPASVSINTVIRLDFTIMNDNGLSVTRTVYVKRGS